MSLMPYLRYDQEVEPYPLYACHHDAIPYIYKLTSVNISKKRPMFTSLMAIDWIYAANTPTLGMAAKKRQKEGA